MTDKFLMLLSSCFLLHPSAGWRDRYAVAFWQRFMRSASVVKPPNILICSGNDPNRFRHFQRLLQSIVRPDCYAVYHYEEKCRWNTWMDNTCLLVMTKSLQDDALVNYVQNGGHLLALDSNIPSELVQSCDWMETPDGPAHYRSASGGVLVELAQDWTNQRLISVLEKFWHIQCLPGGTSERQTLTVGHLIAQNEQMKEILRHPKLIVTDDVHHPVAEKLPVVINDYPSTFDVASYFQHLKTRSIGRSVLYSRVTTSTHWILEDAFHGLPHGMAVIARHQTNGRGRTGNVWLSPEGCAVFSLRLEFALDSALGRHLSLIQHVAALAVVLAVKTLPGAQDVAVGVKWPNDIYVDARSKVGGILATTTLLGSRVLLNLGCGLNLDNQRPTVGLNDLLDRCGSPRLTLEQYTALVFNQLEQLLQQLSEDRLERVMQLYHRYWLHSDSRVAVTEHDGSQYGARVVGIDRFGFLRVRKQCGAEVTVHPDGNSFDLIQGLVVPK